jgi:hypothetical protein
MVGVAHFAFRCGFNTPIIDYTAPKVETNIHRLQNTTEVTSDIIKFNWFNHTNHYGYSCALDGTLFEREYVLNFTQEAACPNFDFRAWECYCHPYLKKNGRRDALCFSESALVNVPCNQVSQGEPCQNGVYYSYSEEELNEKYLQGIRVDLSKIDFSGVNSVQQELEFPFT